MLIADIGGTNARFAIANEDKPGFISEQTYSCADFNTATAAIHHYLDHIGLHKLQSICLAVAGPVVNETVRLTNNSWTLSVDELRQSFNVDNVRLLNDFEAIAYSLPFISREKLLTIGPVEPCLLESAHYTIAVIGAGTGLGAAGLIRHRDNYIAIVGEASHVGFSPETTEQEKILAVLRDRFGRVSCERLVSGTGLENLYRALIEIGGVTATPLSAAEIMRANMNGNNPLATKSVALFYQILGQIAGDLVLTLGANKGVYLAGGITQRYPEQLAKSGFRSSFESKGRHQNLMKSIPTQLITHREPGLLGAASYAQSNFTKAKL